MTALLAGLALLLGAVALALARGFLHARRRLSALEQKSRSLGDAPDSAPRRDDLATIAHDLRAPLSSILGYQELLADGVFGSDDPLGREAIDRIGRAALRLQRLLDAAIELARLETGLARPVFAPTAANRILADAVHDGRALSASPDLSLLDPDDAIPPTLTDAARLRLALDLALLAALHATPPGKLRARAIRTPDGRTLLELAGTALPPEPITPPHEPIPARDQTPLAPLLLADRLLRFLGGRIARVAAGDATTLRITLPRHPPHD